MKSDFLCVSGIVAHVVGAATSEGTLQTRARTHTHTHKDFFSFFAEEIKVSVSVWPPGSNIFVGECVFLQCRVKSNASLLWSYRWFKQKAQPARTSRARHLIAGDSYIIAAVTRQDAGAYWCQAERWLSNTSSLVLLSQPTTFSVKGEEPDPRPQRGVA